MKILGFSLAMLLLASPAAAVAADQSVAPPVVRAPAAVPRAAPCGGSGAACPQGAAAASGVQHYRSGLEAVRPTEDEELNRGVMKMMSHLMAAGRCGEAIGLASRDGRTELADRARQLCRRE